MNPLRFTGVVSCFFALLSVFSIPSASGQTREQASGGQYSVRSWQIEDGLPQNTVAAIAQTADGYLWFGTEEGLARFNGDQFRIFDASSTPALAANQSVRALATDRSDNLWIGTDGAGLIRYRDGRFEPLEDVLRREGAQVVGLYVDDRDRVWVSAAGAGLWRYDHARTPTKIALPDTVQVFSATSDRSGRTYAATSDGLFEIEPDGRARLVDEAFGKEQVRSVHVDRYDRLWAGGRDRIVLIEPRVGPRPYAASGGLAFLHDDTGRMWFGLDGDGLLTADETGRQSFTTESGLTHNRVVSLFQDAEGSVWAGTEGGGIVQFGKSRFTTLGEPEGLVSDQILAVLVATDGTVWAGTEGDGLIALETVSGLTSTIGASELGDGIVASLAEGRDGTIWVGTFFGGLAAVRDGRVAARYGERDGLPTGAVAALHVTRRGTLWVGTDGGLSRLHDGRFTTLNTSHGLGSDYVSAIHEDDRGVLWIGTYDAGLYTLEDGTIRSVPALEGAAVLDIAADRHGRLWIATLHDGVHVLGAGAEVALSRANGLPSNTIYRVLFDDDGFVWMSSNKGLFAVDPAFVSGGGEVHVVTFGSADGMRTVEFNGGVQPAGSVAPDGTMWFPSIRGLVSTDPEIALAPVPVPPVAVEGLRVKGEPREASHAVVSGLALRPGEDKVEIDVASITFGGHERGRIDYRLVPHEETWNSLRSGQTITYTNLAPGSYRLQIRGALLGIEGAVHGDVLEMPVDLRPFVWQRPWFWILLLLAAIAGSVALHRARIRHLRRQQRVLEEQVATRTRELRELNEQLEDKVNAQVNEFMAARREYERSLVEARERAEQSEALKSTLLTNLTHEFRTPISSIIGFADTLAGDAEEQEREFLGYIRQSADRLLETLTAIVDLSELESQAVHPRSADVPIDSVVQEVVDSFADEVAEKGLRLVYEGPGTQTPVLIDASLIRKIVANLVGNAIKFTHEGSVTVALSGHNGQLRLSVADTGVGVDPAFMAHMFDAFTQESTGAAREFEGCGLGLTVVKRLVDMLGGSIEVDSEKRRGSTFTVFLPAAPSQSAPDRGPVTAQNRDRFTARRQPSTSRQRSA